MAWIKRNLIFVIAAAVGVILTGVCAFLLYSAMQKDTTISDDYTQTVNSLNELRQKRPFPDDATIKVAKEDAQRVQVFLNDFRQAFAAFPPAAHEDARGFKDYLQRTIYQLGLDATNAGVLLPPDYAFSWTQQREMLNYPPDCIAPWMGQLEEEKSILRILFGAHINYLEYIKRVPTSCDSEGGSDYIGAASTTNTWGVVTPYSIAFRGFSGDLAAVLSGFATSSNCFIVKDVDVTPSRAALPQVIAAPTPGGAPPPTMYAAPQMMSRRQYGRFGGGPAYPQYAPPQVVQQPGTTVPAAQAAPVTILAENPLYITMAVEVVKLK